MSTTNHLFKFISQETMGDHALTGILNNANAAPELVPIHNKASGNAATPQLIDVVNDFEWTHTPKEGRKDVPTIRLSEYRVEFNSLVQNIRYLLSTAIETGSNVAGGVDKTLKNFNASSKIAKRKAAEASKKIKNDEEKKESFLDKTLEFGADLASEIKGVTIDDSIIRAKHLKPYHGLYGVLPTGFEYQIPYFDSDWRNVSSSWQSIDGKGGLLGGFINEVGNIGSDFVDTLGALPTVKGSGLERPQMYDYGLGGAVSKTIKFSLINTDKRQDVIKNWQLCFMLLYQQLPNKISKVLYEPPVVYEVEIPGLLYTPFAYIRNIAVTNRGAIRSMDVPIPYEAATVQELNLQSAHSDQTQQGTDNITNGTTPRKAVAVGEAARQVRGRQVGGSGSPDPKPNNITTLIPDAYDITINIQSLVPESKNLFFHSTLGEVGKNTGLYDVTLKQGRGTRLTADWLPAGR